MLAARITAGDVEADEASDRASHAKWETEKQILALQATSHADVSAQLQTLRSAYQDCEYSAEVVERVIASALRVLT